jgi:hypothetical protein
MSKEKLNQEISQSADFAQWVKELKVKIHSARNKLAFSINSQILELYWEIGRDIAEKQRNSGWGSGFVAKTAEELRHEFPEINGFSRRNVYAILQWHKFYSVRYEFVPHRVAQIPWGHNLFDVEYALRDINKPIGISEYRLTDAIPDDFKPKLPSVKELEEKLRNQQ